MSEKAKRGFAAISRERQREIASSGGKAAHRQGKAHQWTSEEAQIAGRKGGKKLSIKNLDVNENPKNLE